MTCDLLVKALLRDDVRAAVHVARLRLERLEAVRRQPREREAGVDKVLRVERERDGEDGGRRRTRRRGRTPARR